MAEKPNMYFLNNAVNYTIKRIKEAGEKFNSKELKGAMQYEDVLSLMFAFGAQWRKDTDPNKSDYIEILDSVLNEYTEVIEKEKKAEEERQKRLEQMKKSFLSKFSSESIKVRCDFKYMTNEMYENFVKQGKKFVTFVGGHVFNSFEDSGIDIDGDIIIVDGQKYGVDQDTFSWRNKNDKHKKN